MDWLKGLDDEDILSELEKIARSHGEGDWWEKASRAEKESILKGHQEYLDGKGIPHEEAKKMVSSKLIMGL